MTTANIVAVAESTDVLGPRNTDFPEADDVALLRNRVRELEVRLQAGEERRRAMLHIMSDLSDSNRRLNDQRKAMLHILKDYEQDRKDLARRTEGLNNSRRALMHILQDAHESNLRLAQSRKAMIHIMGDLRQTTEEMGRREHELREKQEQLVQAGKLATLGELTTGVAHELNNPLNNIGLYVGNVLDQVALGQSDEERIVHNLTNVMAQVAKATQIIDHLRTFGRAAPATREPVDINEIIRRAFSLLNEQLRLRLIQVSLDLSSEHPVVLGSEIQLEQVVMNLLANSRDAVASVDEKTIRISSRVEGDSVVVAVEDSGHGIEPGLEERVFDPFFTTKEVGAGTGLGLSIVYGIVAEHDGSVHVERPDTGGARFVVALPSSSDRR